ncbi:F-BAR domain only protein 2 isoform X2 [Rhinichthys klamathensis goyatoka]|uniref:F-BAR domain only protein 2 isoform X2 n=1 Tax=Rhinichthys klamathensis goyatoka TaxID=3034132 RepID=UPI0024B48015|nr:F-BAR domain only protein 2 isoform X2 [Rhinichthys klamathensis goyatoka]
MITPYFLENFWGDKNNGFDVLYHNMKHGQISSKELSDFIRERATIEETYSRSMTKLAKTASNCSQLGTFAPVWDVFKQSTEKLAACHMELVRKLQELIKEVQKYVEEQAKNHKKTKEEVASTLEAVQNIQTVSQALQKSKENYVNKMLEQERMRKEGATQRDLDKAGLKVKKATESYKSYVEKYATAKTEFEQRMTETAQKFQGIEEEHVMRMQEIIHSYSQSVEETHIQIGEVQLEFVNNMENTSVESLIQKLAESKGTGKERPGPIEFEECNVSIATEGAKPRKRKTFAIPGRRRDKDTDSTESAEVEAVNASNGAPPGFYGAIDLHSANVPQLDEEGFCIRPEVNENDAKENSFYSSSDSEDEDEPRKFHVQIKPVQTNNGTHQQKATIDELKASIGNITLSPTPAVHMKKNQSRMTRQHTFPSVNPKTGDELTRHKIPQPSFNELASNDLLSLDPFGPTSTGSSSSLPLSSDLASLFLTSFPTSPPLQLNDEVFEDPEVDLQSEPTSPSAISLDVTEPPALPVPSKLPSPASLAKPCTPSFPVLPFPPSTSLPVEAVAPLRPGPTRALSVPPALQALPKDYATHKPPLSAAIAGPDTLSSWAQSQWIAFNDAFVPCRGPSHQPARPRSVPVSQQPKLFFRETCDPFGSIGKEESTPSLKEAPARSMQDVPPPNRPTTPLGTAAIVPPPRPLSRPKLPAAKLTGINEAGRPFSPHKLSNSSPPPAAPLARAESSSSLSSNTSLSTSNTPTVEDDLFVGKLPTFEKRCETPAGISRGPSPVTLGSQDALPIAVAFTESVNAYFKGADPSKCIVKITGDMTLSFPSGIIKIFTSCPSPAVLSFKLSNTSKLEQIMPNQQLLHSDSSQSDTNSKDFWLNMSALTAYLRKSSEQNPAASYYNVDILKYQACSNGIQSTPLNLVVYWKCAPTTTDLRVDYRYNPEAMQPPAALTNLQVLVPVTGGVTNMQSLPNAIWNAEQSKTLWKLSDISVKSENEGSGSLRAKFELSDGPSIPATLAVQFFSEGSTLSGVDMELVGSGYRLSLNKKRFASGRYMADC